MSHIPEHAIAVWAEGDMLVAVLPGYKTTHQIRVPMTPRGLEQIVGIAAAQAEAPRATVATKAAPTQAQVDAWMKTAKAKAKAKPTAPAQARTLNPTLDSILRRMGLL